jgi:hypothetical protein
MKTICRAVGCTVVVALLGLALLPGCGMSPKAEAPNSATEAAPAPGLPSTGSLTADEAEAEPTTLADAEALLEKARADLDRLALNEPGAARGATGGAPAPASAPPSPSPEPAAPRAEAKRADKATSADQAAAPPTKEVNPCETACKAFSSLTRASDAVCRLDTDGGKRCERARQIREDAAHRVASCGCTK